MIYTYRHTPALHDYLPIAYRYFAGTPVYPFGYGLSYASFADGPRDVRPAAGGAGKGLHVSTVVTNTGQRAGDDVAQLYLTFPDIPGTPRVALRGFQRVSLAPGERRAVDRQSVV